MVSPARRVGTTLAAALGLLMLVSCTPALPGAVSLGSAGGAPAAGTPAGLERYYGQRPAWGSCTGFAASDADRAGYADPRLECARLEVPLDYAVPEGRTAQVAVLRHRTTEPGRIGSLVLNPGGPGGSGVALAASLSERLGDGPFDIVGFDPRGVGASTPRIDCLTDAEWDADRADDTYDPSPAGVARDEAEARRTAEHCAERSGGADVLAHSGTRDVVRDMDVLRAVLGDQKLSYLGFSYGTRIGATYAEMFPGTVRAMVLDGAVDPDQDTESKVVGQRAGFQRAFEAFALACARQDECPLGDDPAGATARFQELSRPLIDRPAPTRAGRPLSYGDLITAVSASLYNARSWPRLAQGLTELADGDGSNLLARADEYEGRSPTGTYDNSKEVQLVVNCMDRDRITDRARAADLQRKAREAAPFADPGRGVSGALGTCAFLPPTPDAGARRPIATDLPTTVVISTTGDPATPYQSGVNLAETLHARLLTVEGTQHTAAMHGDSCVDGIVLSYLEELTLPAAGTRCRLGRP
jgi:pimeloyl-ACP methyl ester carboxylesterase